MSDSARIEELKRRVQMDPASIAFAALAEEYRRAGRFEEAIAACTAGLLRHPSYLSAHVTLGRALIEVGRYQDAREELEHVLKLAPENLAAIRGLADISHRIGDDLPERYSEAAVRHAAGDPEPVPAPIAVPAPIVVPAPIAVPAPIDRGDPRALADLPALATAPLAAGPIVSAPRITPALVALDGFLLAIARTRASRAAGR